MNELELAAVAQCKAGVATQGIDPETYTWEACELPRGQGVYVRCYRLDVSTETVLQTEGILPLEAIAVDKKGA